MPLADLRYPVVCLAERTGPSVVARLDELARSRPSLVRAGHFVALRVVDADGRTHAVTEAEIIAPRTRLARWGAALLDLPVRMHLTLQELPAIDVNELRDQLTRELAAEPALVEEQTNHSLDWWREHLDSATSVPDLVRRFAAGVAAG